jgi:hypothetical protein
MNAHSPSGDGEPAAVLFTRIDSDLHALGHLVDGLEMAAGAVLNAGEANGLSALVGVVAEKVAGLKTGIRKARDTLDREQEGA